jgi:hypothetical protein
MKRVISCLLISIISANFASGGDKKTAPLPAPLIPSEQVWFFGIIPEGATVCHHYVLTNYNPEPVTITEIIPGCDCTHVPKTPITIATDESYLLKVDFDTKTYFGQVDRDIQIITDFKINPKLEIYFTSYIAKSPETIKITPSSTAFIPGKDSQVFSMENLSDKKTEIMIIIDNDSSLTVSETDFKLEPKQKAEFAVSAKWDLFERGSTYRTLFVRVTRDDSFRVSLPIKINKF